MSRNVKIRLSLFLFITAAFYFGGHSSFLGSVGIGLLFVLMSFADWQPGDGGDYPHNDPHAINPANGLPMVGGMGGTDIKGNPYGSDYNH